MARTTRSKVDAYIDRSTKWPEVMTRLRPILAGCGLTEEIKWGKPCFSQDGHNIVIFQEMKEFLALMFFKGALLSDPDGILEEQGPNSRSALRICFRSIDDANRLADTVKAYVEEAIDVEEAGLQVAPAPVLPPPEELQNRLETDPAFKAAFEALTPGRQREYNLYFSDAKQSKTRNARVDKYAPKILAGKGFRDR
ncbi:YdeI/OmpD-associated family protein [Candidatus Microthrix sp.]|nr:YdeI/OmpD-associated family protein [Candidatus Microthrix sp.]